MSPVGPVSLTVYLSLQEWAGWMLVGMKRQAGDHLWYLETRYNAIQPSTPCGEVFEVVGSQLVFGEELIGEKGIKDIRAPKVGFVEFLFK